MCRFWRLVQDGSQGGACCSFAKTENEIHEEDGANLRGWEPDDSWHRVAAETLTEWENWNAMVPLLMETARTHRKMETKELSVTELELKSLQLRRRKQGDNSEGQSCFGSVEKYGEKDEP